MTLGRFRIYTWGVLIFNLGVILWGAYVRATGSGAGCGSHWPLCNGEVVPRSPAIETLIEYIHRISSGLAFLLVLMMLYGAFRLFPKGHLVRYTSIFSLIFMITEALIGAGLVIFGWVANDTSVARAAAVSIHLVNTFLLLSFVTLTAWWASANTFRGMIQLNPLNIRIAFGLLGIVVLGVTGSITALGDTLFPVDTLSSGLQQDFNPASHFLIRLRVWHPVLAILLGLYILGTTGLIGIFQTNLTLKHTARFVFMLFLFQWAVGLINLLLRAPIFTQLLHLFLADMVWITMVVLLAVACECRAPFIVSKQATE